MVNVKIVLFIPIFWCCSVYGQVPSIQWQKCYISSNYESGNAIQQTTDSGYVVAGHKLDSLWIFKIDLSGTIQWQKAYGGSSFQSANSVQQTSDGGFIVGGSSNSNDGDVSGNHGSLDYWILKLDAVGNLQWEKSFGGSSDDQANSIQQTLDGGYIVAGTSNSSDGDVTGSHGSNDYWILKLDVTGNIQWKKSFGGSSDDESYSIKQTLDKGFITTGYSASNNGDVSGNHGGAFPEDFWIVKLDSLGNLQWQKTLGGSGQDDSFSILQSPGGYIIAGLSNSNNGDVAGNHGSVDYWVVKIDLVGNLIWQKSLGGSGNDAGHAISMTVNNGFAIAGQSDSNDGDVTGNHGSADFWLVQLDSLGNLEWQKSLGGTAIDGCSSIQQTFDGGYIAAGDSWSNNGDVSGSNGGLDCWVVKLNAPVGVNENKKQFIEYLLYPNPTVHSFTIRTNFPAINSSCFIYDVMGRKLVSGKLTGENTIVNIEGLESGAYFFQVGESGSPLTKIIKE